MITSMKYLKCYANEQKRTNKNQYEIAMERKDKDNKSICNLLGTEPGKGIRITIKNYAEFS